MLTADLEEDLTPSGRSFCQHVIPFKRDHQFKAKDEALTPPKTCHNDLYP